MSEQATKPPPVPACGNCFFYRDGKCARNPPSFVVFHPDQCGEWCQPWTSKDWWCGQYKSWVV